MDYSELVQAVLKSLKPTYLCFTNFHMVENMPVKPEWLSAETVQRQYSTLHY